MNYAEMQVTVPGQGIVTLWRGRNYKEAISERCNRGLRKFNGLQVVVCETTTTRKKPMGWFGGAYGS